MATALRSGQTRQKGRAVNVRIVLLIGISLAVVGGLTWWLLRRSAPANDAAVKNLTSSTQDAQLTFAATIVSSTSPPSSPPEGMVYIPGGEFSMGSLDPTDMVCGGDEPMNDARPLHRVYVDGFFMDATEVTNEQFEQFAKSTGYVTIAERKPTREEFPTAPAENLGFRSLLARLDRSRSTITTSGGATSRAPTGVIPPGRPAT